MESLGPIPRRICKQVRSSSYEVLEKRRRSKILSLGVVQLIMASSFSVIFTRASSTLDEVVKRLINGGHSKRGGSSSRQLWERGHHPSFDDSSIPSNRQRNGSISSHPPDRLLRGKRERESWK